MYKAFKEHLLAKFSATCAQTLPDFLALKSAARGGGLTLRRKLSKQLHLFIGVEPIPQHESAQLFVAWSKHGAVPKFDDLQWECGRRLRGRSPEPQALLREWDEGCLDATAFGGFTNAIQLQSSVPWPTIAERLAVDAKFSRSFRNIWGEAQAEAALAGAAGLPDAGMSWEQWFLFIDPAIPSQPSVETLMSPFVREMNEQMDRFFIPFLTSCTAE